MTPKELQDEWLYRFQERIGMLCSDMDPTPEQVKIAQDCADEAADKLRKG